MLLRPEKSWSLSHWRELWNYRELLLLLIIRDVKVRYKQTFLGAAWAILQPFLSMVVFSIFFGRVARMPSEGAPYPLFAYAGLLPWTYFSQSLTQGSRSLVDSSHLVRKVYFPRLILPASNVLSGLLDFLIALAFYFVLMAFYGRLPTWNLALLPAVILMTVAASMGPCILLAALNVQYRDVRFVVPFLTQFWMFATPLIYPSSMLHEPWRTLYGLNPMAGVVEGFRWALLGSPLLLHTVAVSSATSLLCLVFALAYFQHAESKFADVV
jgi:lipopolysaccharide transport system permease protein